MAVKGALAACCAAAPALAQQAGGEAAAAPATVQEVVITGSRIQQSVAESTQPLSVISSEQIEKTGLASVGDLLQQLTTGGKALNQKFNSSGNFGYPPDGGGIGAGSSQVDLRNLDSKRTLVLVDGLRWVNESSASGVSGSADLNTIPLSIIDHIEVLEDGASSIYGSDAIAGVVNIITRKKMEGVEVSGYVGEFSKGGRTTEGSLTVGGSSGKFSGLFVASYYDQEAISSAKWWQSSEPEPRAGIASGSSATPQGRATFCDPSIPVPNYGSCTPDQSNFYDVTLNTGTTMPVWSPTNPVAPPSTYHNWSGADRFNFAPLNLLLTPSQRKALWGSVAYDITDDVQLYAKGMFNNRQSANQAAPEPIFVGPYAGTGGIADTISISHLNPYNPFGIDLCAVASPTCGAGVANFGWITRRPIEAGPRIFTQDVDTWYFSTGLRGTLHLMEGFTWDINFVDTDNKAQQKFIGGYNIGNVALALGDPAICARVPNCVPLDLFGGQGRPITQQMLNFIEATQIDQSDQKLKLISANITGTIFHIEDRAAGLAIGAEHRHYDGEFNPDPLRQTGLSQDSLAFPVSASYRVNEAYGEISLPLLKSLGLSGAARYSDYSTFGSTTTYKGGIRWQPIDDFALRGTYSTGFRAPNLGELYGLTQFGATLVDPCGPTGGGIDPKYAAGCAAQHIPPNFQQANTQITTFTGGNPNLKPEKSDSYTAGFVYRAGWAEGRGGTSRLSFETSYYHHKVKGAIQAEDIQQLLNACLAAGGLDPNLCAPFTRGAGSQLNPPKNFLQNLAQITTSGLDFKLSWLSEPLSFGHLSAALQATRVNDYKAVDTLGLVAQRTVGIEVADSSIPRWRANAQLGWGVGGFDVNWNLRFLDAVQELCGNAATTIAVPGCTGANNKFSASVYHNLHSVLYHDIQVSWTDAFRLTGLKIDLGVNNVFGTNPPVCYTCTLNGYDAGTYDLPGAFWNARATFKF
ncbi:MAG: TonB-dependent receptor [Gammaproteobacteria bacterium]|nr:TonB-dependent receptor [Gammaproteobacteria bacterium]